MSQRLKYFQKLGLQPTTDQKEIKKAYRKKALEFHPDVNPSQDAQRKFVEITAAYEILLGLKIINSTPSTVQPKSAQEVKAENMKKAKERYQKIKETEEYQDAQYFERITSGWRWKGFKIFAFYSVILSILLSCDYFMTSNHKGIETLTSYPHFPNTVKHNGEVFEIPPTRFWQGNFPPVQANYGFFFKDLKSLSVVDQATKRDLKQTPSDRTNKFDLFENYTSLEYYSYGSVYYLFPVLHITLFLPIFLVYFKRQRFSFSVARLFSLWVLLPSVIYMTFYNGRILHLVGLL